MKRFAVLLAVLLLFVTVTAVSAQEKQAPEADPCKSAAIDSETKVKIQKLKLQYELDMVDLQAEKDKIHQEIMAELLGETPSTKTIEKLGKSMNGIQHKMFKIKMDYMLKAKKVVPADHWKVFLSKQHHGAGAGGGKACCATTAGHKCSSSCTHGSARCSMAGTKGHVCTTACTHPAAKTGCKTPCVKVKK